MKLVIANKCYSSWSLRPWILMRQAGIPFEEVLVPFGPTFDDPAWKAEVGRYTPAGKVPTLVDGDVAVWESIAIMDYLAERFPDRAIWPTDRTARAMARSLAAEMHAGFGALRNACPMNLGKKYAYRDRGEAVNRDVARVVSAWRQARERFGQGGPFLFGEFSAADAMYAPVVTRLDTYSFPVDAATRAYMDAVLTTPAFRAWREAALAEHWIVDADEVAEEALENYRQAA
ncbi:glutathione S-transferase family protein [Chelatococcus sp. SYSU_G07232]|uniref:Glutathione S-transferase family protein n=1 Tax=Chelatococcus albus TaxID=3047466 RepID=A0ABT7AGR3_9HYPH|nr:glutathione S-transferase family protein [Chelatococcus sp. SYSU_G07232]MDJ1158564.1 glutathione S-transferase family protein [Chelatococcus sp. SYSU_G07232]